MTVADRRREPSGVLPTEAWVLAMASLPGVGPARLAALVAAGPPATTWARLASGERVVEPVGPGRDLGRRWCMAAANFDVAACWERHRRAGVGMVTPTSPGWPADAFDGEPVPPELLLWHGDIGALTGARVAVVGTRSCTRYGLDVAAGLGRTLAAAGVSVLSGLALGIDAAVHQAVVEVGGAPPVAVVGSGLDVVYPSANTRLWRAVVASGLVLTEAPLGTRPEPWRFPQRNRIIAALADVVVVVESHQRGGAVITARHALEQGRTVLVVPGALGNPASAGCHDLIADGAGIYRGPDDVLVALGMTPGARRRAGAPQPAPAGIDGEVLAAMPWTPATLGDLVEATGTSVAEVALATDRLVAGGWLERSGGWFQRVAGSPKAPQ